VDNVAHTLAGAALGEAGLRKLSGLGMTAAVISANVPDIDVLAVAFGMNTLLRRGWTHGPLAAVVLPIAVTAVLVGWDRLQQRRGRRPEARPPVRAPQLLLISLLAFLTHPFLDWVNTYGIRLLMPFSDRWFYGDSVFIIDLWIWLVLAAGVFYSRGRRRLRLGRPGWPSGAALGAVAAYILLMFAGSWRTRESAIGTMSAMEQRVPIRVMAGPVPLNSLRRQLIFDMGDHYRFGSARLIPRLELSLSGESLAKNMDQLAAQQLLSRRDVREFLYWSRFPFVVIDSATGRANELGDARFLTPRAGRDAFTLDLHSPDTP
jgi:inner membrane protein